MNTFIIISIVFTLQFTLRKSVIENVQENTNPSIKKIHRMDTSAYYNIYYISWRNGYYICSWKLLCSRYNI